MPRSGRGTRRKPAQAKHATSPGNVEPASIAAATTFPPRQAASDPARYARAESFMPLSMSAQGSRVFSEAPQPLADPTLQTPLPSSTHRLPQPLPSPSFRFPSASSIHPISSYAIATHVATSPQYDEQSEPTPASFGVEGSHHARGQHLPAQYPLYPSHAQEYGRDGSSFRATQSTPTRASGIEHSSTGNLKHTGAHTAPTSAAGGHSEPAPGSRARPSFSTKPVLPCQSSSGFTKSELRTFC